MTTEQDLQRFDFQPRPVRDDQRAGALMLYRDLDGVRTPPVSGADGLAFFKDPPVVAPAVMWRAHTVTVDAPTVATINALPAATTLADLELLQVVNVTDTRALSLLVDFYAVIDPAAEEQLYLVMFAGMDLPQQEYADDERTIWAPIGVINQTLLGTDAAPFSLGAPSVGFRNAYGSQINFRAQGAPAFDPAAPSGSLALAFDVSLYSKVRLGLGASSETCSARVHYQAVR